MKNYKNKNVAVLGLGIEGRDLVKYLLAQGANITLHDGKPAEEIDFGGIDKSSLKLVCGEGYLGGLDKYDVVFRSPGVYRFNEELLEIDKKGVEISSAIKLFMDTFKGEVVGVTGTKGKGTTSTLIYSFLKEAGKDVYLAGNIGKPYLELIDKTDKDSIVVLELSSFQLIDLDISPHVSVVLNITTDHLDWHKDRQEYVDAKRNIVKNQGEDDFAVINADYNDPMTFSDDTSAKCFYFSREKKVDGAYVVNRVIKINTGSREIDIGDADKLLLRGEHNWENITAALCVANIYGLTPKQMREVVYGFKGLEHRLELVKSVKGVTYYNDSFATGPQSTSAAIKSFTEDVTVILGGFDKGLNYDELASEIEKQRNVKNIILIGDISGNIKGSLEKVNYSGNVIEMGYPTMKEIVAKCVEVTKPGDVVILSPGTSSFDMFESYKQRGNFFRDEVNKL